MSQEPQALRGPEWSWHPGHNPWLIALTVTMATFMEVLDTSIANVALPHIAGGLSAGVDESTWVLTSYLVSNAVVLPLSGWLSNRFGRKRFYMTCVAIFATSSFFCGIAPSLEMLILFRVMQGAGGGGLQPSEQAILADTFPASKRGMAFAVYGMAVVAAPALGPTLGGWITDNFTWRWIFFINVPVGIISLLLTSRMVTDPPYMRQSRKAGLKIDYIGFALIALGLGFLQVVLDKGQRDDWFESHHIVISTMTAVLALAGAVVWEWFHKDPVVDIHLLRDRTFLTANVLMFMVGFALLASTLLLPLFAQTMIGYTAELAGMMISPGGVAIILLLPLVGYLTTHYDARVLIAFGLVVVSVSLFRMTQFDLGVDFATLMWTRVLQACGLAFLFVPINTVAYSFLPREKNNAASGFINLSRNIGGSFGISVVTTMLSRRAQVHQVNLAGHVNSYSPGLLRAFQGGRCLMYLKGASTADAARKAYGLIYAVVSRQANMLAYLDDFRLLAVVILVMVPFVFLMRKPRPNKGALAVH